MLKIVESILKYFCQKIFRIIDEKKKEKTSNTTRHDKNRFLTIPFLTFYLYLQLEYILYFASFNFYFHPRVFPLINHCSRNKRDTGPLSTPIFYRNLIDRSIDRSIIDRTIIKLRVYAFWLVVEFYHVRRQGRESYSNRTQNLPLL